MAWISWTYGNGGWIEYRDTELPMPVRVRFVEVGDRLQVSALHLEGGVTADVLRALPTGHLELVANQPEMADELRRALVEEGPTVERRTKDWLAKITPAQSEGADVVVGRRRRPSARIRVPEGRKRPDRFYAEVARVFAEVAGWTPAPAQEIAKATGVPTSTVHRWVKEARRRGLLGAARRAREEG
jgi:hypothetical protein